MAANCEIWEESVPLTSTSSFLGLPHSFGGKWPQWDLHSQTFIAFGLKILFSTNLLDFFFAVLERNVLFVFFLMKKLTIHIGSCMSLLLRIISFKMETCHISTLSFFCDSNCILFMLISIRVLKFRKGRKLKMP